MPKFECVRECYFRKEVWTPGREVNLSEAEAKDPCNAMVVGPKTAANRKCFRLASVIAPAPAAAKAGDKPGTKEKAPGKAKKKENDQGGPDGTQGVDGTDNPQTIARSALIDALQAAKVKGWSEAMTDQELRACLAKAGIDAV